MKNKLNFLIYSIFFFSILITKSVSLENCAWKNKDEKPCITISKTSNTSAFSSQGVNKTIITKRDIERIDVKDLPSLLETIPGFSIYQDGPIGQKASIFTRGSESNHTLVLLNGIAINDQSTTDGMHDFGQDFLKTIQQIEIYKGSNGAHFGPSAISGAINLITDIDYNNHVSTTLLDKQNNTLYGNYTKITSDDLHINLKASTLKGKSRSALADGSEEDGVKNYQTNLNLKKWINDNLKLTSTLYTRKTEADYDSSVSKETGYTSNNKMHSLQTGLEHISKNSENFFKLHYHNYDRDYEDGGHLDEYESKALVAKGETKVILSDKISYGIGSEYKYDWGSFENRGNFKQSTKGHIKNLGFFGNTGYKFTENSILSLYGRTDDHNTTGGNQTYKVNFTKFINVFKLSLTHSTGLRNPSLYELYGSNNYGYKGHTGLNPEKSKSNELNTTYNFSENLIFDLTAYKTTIFERLEDNGSYTATENKKIGLNQEGIETGMLLQGTDQSFSIFSNFAKSKKTNGQSQVRRPDFSLGSNYSKNKINTFIGSLDFNLNYKYTGKHIDLDNGRKKMKSTDIINMSLSKEYFGNVFSINISNLLNERYERPATYSQEGRQLNFSFKKVY